MTSSAKIPGRWRRNDPITAKKLDQPRRALADMLRGVAMPRQVNPNSASSAPEVRRFKISEIKPDYLLCVQWDGITEGAATYIAKPFLLRGSATTRTFSGGTLTFGSYTTDGGQREATLDAVSETQVIVPEYVVGDEIVAVRNVRGKTGVTREDADAEVEVIWLDMNTDARAWAKKSS